MPNAILIAGPTASGKSALALRLAEKLDGIIINADSMQVYRDLRILTARPSEAEERRVLHLLYGHVDAAKNYSVGHWYRDVRRALDEAQREGRRPILVGGTGLYFKALLHGLAAVPPIPANVRARLCERLAAEGLGALHAELVRRDPLGAARIMPGDRSRIMRALEVVLATGRPLAEWHEAAMPPVLAEAETLKVFLDVQRPELYQGIEARFDAMLGGGALEEVRALAARRLDPMLPAMKAHGVPWLLRHLAGELTLEEAGEGVKRDTRRYTKRQKTWFRHQLAGWQWLTPTAAEQLLSNA